MDFIPVELARLFYSRIKPKVSVELLGEGNRSKEPISAIRTTALKKPTPRRD